jgi:hypothetical protein
LPAPAAVGPAPTAVLPAPVLAGPVASPPVPAAVGYTLPVPRPLSGVPTPLPFEAPGFPPGARDEVPGGGGSRDVGGDGLATLGQQLLSIGQDVRRLLERIADGQDPDPDERDEGRPREGGKVVWREREGSRPPEVKEEPGKESGSLLSRLFGGAASGGGGFRPPRPVP